ncbi:MAG: hypothetical protein MZW92_40095 [Comamonadaceae bacterium]|nr:hypothetical protein [Comamonadaceae bacterium]
MLGAYLAYTLDRELLGARRARLLGGVLLGGAGGRRCSAR